MPGSLDLGYLAYLAANVPPWDIARAVAVRARRAVRGGIPRALTPFFFQNQISAGELLRRALSGRRPSIVDPGGREATARLLRERYPEAARLWRSVLSTARAEKIELPEPVHLNLARALVEAGDLEGARKVLQEYLELEKLEPAGGWRARTQAMLDQLPPGPGPR